MKRAIAFVAAIGVGLLLYFSCDTRGTGGRPLSPREPPAQVAESVGAPGTEVAESILRATERLPVVEEIAKTAKTTTSADELARFVPTKGCTSRALLKILMSAPRERDLKCIWDARDFNPRRVPVTRLSREHCLRALQPYVDAAADLRRTANSSAMQEFRQSVEQRRPGLPFISLDDYVAILRQRAPGLLSQATVDREVVTSKLTFMPTIAFEFEPNLFRFAGDGWFGSRIADMETARPAYEAMAFTSLELVRAVIEFGLAFGTLTTDEAEQLRAAAIANFNEMLN